MSKRPANCKRIIFLSGLSFHQSRSFCGRWTHGPLLRRQRWKQVSNCLCLSSAAQGIRRRMPEFALLRRSERFCGSHGVSTRSVKEINQFLNVFAQTEPTLLVFSSSFPYFLLIYFSRGTRSCSVKTTLFEVNSSTGTIAGFRSQALEPKPWGG